MNWLVLHSGPGDAAFNMALDEALLEAMPRWQWPVLRFYGWTEPAATFGYFQRHADVARTTHLRPLIRRPTGGGIVPHDADWTYSLTFPVDAGWHPLRAEESYRRVHERIQQALAALDIETGLAPCCQKTAPGQCFAGYEKFDLLWHGRKIAGAAQRRNRLGLLIQGSVQPPPVPVARADWERAMAGAAESITPPAELLERAGELARVKYSQAGYNEKR
jgi:lipoyl(octanoyl) transferase